MEIDLAIEGGAQVFPLDIDRLFDHELKVFSSCKD